ncbi:hypothetical protein [Amphibacillus jilinensis]|uniref:hypothetical protein n=1 Tax=Amphibacillus jilinensis TaxID=1216008 RepID=UPI0002DA09E9|nr:hypothetical protein [Amphibacillus jilinensis]
MIKHKIINNFIILPFVLTLFKKDRHAFNQLKFNYLYEQFFDQLIEQVQKDIIANKQLMYSKYKINVQLVERTTKTWRYKIYENSHGRIIEFTPNELKEMTITSMNDYLLKKKGVLTS